MLPAGFRATVSVMRVWVGATVLVLGCAGAPTRIAAPEPCTCPHACCETPRATVAIKPTAPGKNVRLDEATERDYGRKALLKVGFVVAAEAALARACERVAPSLPAIVDGAEPAALVKLRAARDFSLSSTGDPAERSFLAWAMYDDAIGGLRNDVAKALAMKLSDDVMKQPAIVSVFEEAAYAAHNYEWFEYWTPGFTQILDKLARDAMQPLVDEASLECAERGLAERRPRYLQIFKGKSP